MIWRWCRAIAIGLFSLLLMVGCTAMAIDGSVAYGALNSGATDEQPALSGDSRFLAFVSDRDGQNQLLIYDLRRRSYENLLDLKRSRAIVESPALSYTGRYIVYSANESGRPDIFLYDRLTRRLEMLTRGYRGWVRNPSISPDGRYVTFESARKGQWDIEIFDRGPNIEPDTVDSGFAVPEPPSSED